MFVSILKTILRVDGTTMPKQMQICDRAPDGPLTSVGATSTMYFGQKQENPPVATPYKNLPMRKGIHLPVRVRPAPTMTKRLAIIIHFHLPMPINGPAMRAPTAEPAVVIDCAMA